MTFHEIQSLILKQPWRPVEFVMDDGTRWPVASMSDILWTVTGSRLILCSNGDELRTTPGNVKAVRRLRSKRRVR